LGGSEWYALNGFVGNQVPVVRAEKAKALYDALSCAIQAGLVASCHDCADGGLAVALAETAFSGGLGMSIDLACVPAKGIHRNDVLLFSESQSRFVVTISPDVQEPFEAMMKGVTIGRVGTVLPEGILKIQGIMGNRIIEEDIHLLKAIWQQPLNF